MIEIKKLTIQDLTSVKASLCNASPSITWYGKKIVQINHQSFSLDELTEKILEISSHNMSQLTQLERLSGLETLQIIKELSHQAKKQLKTNDCFTLFIRAIIWIQEYTLGIVLPKWREKYTELARKEAKNNFVSFVDESGEIAKAKSKEVRLNAYKQLLLDSAAAQKKSIEVIEYIKNWCNGIDIDEIPGLALFCQITEFDNPDYYALESILFIINTIPYCMEQICSKNLIEKVAKIFWESCEDKKNFQKKLQILLQTENSSLNTFLNQAKKCAQNQDFPGIRQALIEVFGILHQIQTKDWSFAADHIPVNYEPKERITEHEVENISLLSDGSTSPVSHKVQITLEDGRKALHEIGPFEFKALLNIFPDTFTLHGEDSVDNDAALIRNQPNILKDFSLQLSEAKRKEERSAQKTCDIGTFLSFAFEKENLSGLFGCTNEVSIEDESFNIGNP